MSETEAEEAKKMAEIEATMKRRALILDSLNIIPVFTGQDLTWTLEQFRTKFSAVADFLLWPEEDQLFAIQQRLAGLALQTFINFKHNIKTVKDLFDVLQEKFGSKRDQGDLLNDFWLFKQQQDHSVAEFIAKANVKATAAISAHNLPKDCEDKTKQEWLISMLQKNLLPQIRKGVIARNPKSLKELEEIALLEERAYKSVPLDTTMQIENSNLACAITANRNNQTDRNNKTDRNNQTETDYFRNFARELKEQLNFMSDKISKLENDFQKRKQDDIVCFRCKLNGHIQRFCPQLESNRRRFNDAPIENNPRPRNENRENSLEERGQFQVSRDPQTRGTNAERTFYPTNRGRSAGRGFRGQYANRGFRENNLNY